MCVRVLVHGCVCCVANILWLFGIGMSVGWPVASCSCPMHGAKRVPGVPKSELQPRICQWGCMCTLVRVWRVLVCIFGATCGTLDSVLLRQVLLKFLNFPSNKLKFCYPPGFANCKWRPMSMCGCVFACLFDCSGRGLKFGPAQTPKRPFWRFFENFGRYMKNFNFFCCVLGLGCDYS